MSIEVTLYKRPHGRSETIEIEHIKPDDEAWFKEHNAKLSQEYDPGLGTIVYADLGFRLNDDPDEDPEEVIVVSGSRSCEQTMTKLREECEKMIAERSTNE